MKSKRLFSLGFKSKQKGKQMEKQKVIFARVDSTLRAKVDTYIKKENLKLQDFVTMAIVEKLNDCKNNTVKIEKCAYQNMQKLFCTATAAAM